MARLPWLFGGDETNLVKRNTSLEDSIQNTIQLNVHANGTNIFNKAQFYLLKKTDLRQSFWETNSVHTVTGLVTQVTATNFGSQGYFMVKSKE